MDCEHCLGTGFICSLCRKAAAACLCKLTTESGAPARMMITALPNRR